MGKDVGVRQREVNQMGVTSVRRLRWRCNISRIMVK